MALAESNSDKYLRIQRQAMQAQQQALHAQELAAFNGPIGGGLQTGNAIPYNYPPREYRPTIDEELDMRLPAPPGMEYDIRTDRYIEKSKPVAKKVKKENVDVFSIRHALQKDTDEWLEGVLA
jgi:hypothetical protein